ncbi:Gfo/Idh/MocA family oxidoreductase [Streptomyces sp. NPDC006552]|uniref:Gfo/Idh/MocA family protein n=1 Tax=Streptomyces sp. NPDC006552 TaxID=3157179 RepID=UPI00339E1281
MGKPLTLGLIGAGVISGQYLETIARLDDLALVAVADLDPARAAAAADAHGATALTVPELLRREDIDAVLNLTVPAAHADTSRAAIDAGKAVYVEKPLAATAEQARGMLAAAAAAGVVLGCAPDTVLGTGVQTARAAVDGGAIGTPVGATVTMVTPGHERWHPAPDFYYRPGGGPLLDMGPYYLTTLVTLLGPVVSATGAASALRGERVIGSGPRAGQRIPVTTPTHVTGALVHASGALSTLLMSFDAMATHAAPIEVHGTDGSLAVPDPNGFSGDVRLDAGRGWEVLPVSAGYRRAARGYGLADLVWSGAFAGDPAAGRAGGALAFHVLEVMEAVLTAAAEGRSIPVTSTVTRPAPVPLDDR